MNPKPIKVKRGAGVHHYAGLMFSSVEGSGDEVAVELVVSDGCPQHLVDSATVAYDVVLAAYGEQTEPATPKKKSRKRS